MQTVTLSEDEIDAISSGLSDDPAKRVTFSAARRRYQRKQGEQIIKLTRRQSQFLSSGLAHYAICDNNTLTAWGDIDAVNDWCREAGVLAHNEIVVEAA